MDVQMGGTADDEFSDKSWSFLHFLQEKGTTTSTKIQLADLRQHDAGRGVVATEDIAEDEELFSIPRSSILTTETSDLPEEIKSQVKDPWLGMILAMIYEYQLGNDSAWAPYFNVLPHDFDTLMFWSDDELQALQGSAVASKIGKAAADTTFSQKLLPIIRTHADVFRAFDLTDQEVLKLCHRMGSTIMAYAFDLEKPSSAEQQPNSEEDGWEEDDENIETAPKGMMPLADMLNADAERNNAKLYYEDGRVVMKSIKPIKAGEELFNDYGPLPTADLVRRYGYITPNYAHYDVVEVSLDSIEQVAENATTVSAAEVKKRSGYLSEQGALDDAYDIGRPANEDGEQFPDELCILLNTLTLPTEDFERLKTKEKMPKPALSKAGAKLLMSVLEKRQARYPRDVQVTESGGMSATARWRKAMAEQIIRGEQQVLVEALQILHSMTDTTAGAEKRKPEAPAAEVASKKHKGR